MSNSFADSLRTNGIKYTFVPLARNLNAMFYEPVTENEKSSIAILVMHPGTDYLTKDMYLMARYGYRVLCADVTDIRENLNKKIAEAKKAVEFLRGCESVKNIVLWGHSGGGTLLSAYQKIAENGAASCQGDEKIHKCSDELDGLSAADGLMLIDSNWGNAVMSLLSVDPAVTDENGLSPLDPELDLFNPENGFDPDGSTFSDEFIKKFQKAQGERNNRIIDNALSRLQKIENGESFYIDDEPLNVIGAAQGFMNNKLYAQDIRLLSHTRKPCTLVHRGGVTTTEIVHTMRGPENKTSFTRTYSEGVLLTSVRNYLSEFAIRTLPDYGYNEDSLWGVDWSSTYSTPVGNVESIKVPTLVMGMTAGWEYIASETIYEHSASSDKHLAFVEGATHIYKTMRGGEEKYGNAMDTIFDYVDKWLSASGRYID